MIKNAMKLFDNTDPTRTVTVPTVRHFKKIMGQIHIISVLAAVGSITVFGGLGYLLDLALDKKNFCTIIGLAIGFVFMHITSVIMSQQLLKSPRIREGIE